MGFFSRRFSGLLLRLGASGPVALGAAAIASYLCLGAPGAAASETSAEAARSHLYAATLAGGADDLARLVAANSQDMEARFGLGMIQFVRAVEKLCQAQYRYGIQQPDPHILLPLLRFPIPPNPNPEAIDYDAFRAMLQDFIVDLATSEATLAGIGERPATVVVDLMQVRLNVTGAIKSGEGIRLIDLIAAISARAVDGRRRRRRRSTSSSTRATPPGCAPTPTRCRRCANSCSHTTSMPPSTRSRRISGRARRRHSRPNSPCRPLPTCGRISNHAPRRSPTSSPLSTCSTGRSWRLNVHSPHHPSPRHDHGQSPELEADRRRD